MLLKFPDSDSLHMRETGECFSCGKEDYIFKIGAMSDRFKCCRACIKEWGRRKLAHAADKILALAKPEKAQASFCHHCGKEQQPDAQGRYKIQCEDCNREFLLLLQGL